ncbi:Hypothetical predicted protein [Paramuricea clavata]|uniref:Uncharacterized protein n=1 Tax=Paramuricea clavata TaxID=317549 RepID=A0A7D9I7E4_PARCT|nr:Hypothetical predicted protein [Paramuricea clavata]
MDNATLDNHLRLFYAEVKNQDGDDYSKSTLLGLRYGLERYLNSPPHNKGITISGNPEFKKSNVVLNTKLKSLKQGGKENVQHKPPLEPEDLQKLKISVFAVYLIVQVPLGCCETCGSVRCCFGVVVVVKVNET